jgi:integrase
MSEQVARAAAGSPAWRWPLDLDRYDRRAALTELELASLRTLGWKLRRRIRPSCDPDAPEWQTIARLLGPLDDARAALRWGPTTTWHRYAPTDAIGLILHVSAAEQTAFWGWTPQAWARLMCPNEATFEQSWKGLVISPARPYVATLAYMLCGFVGFQQLGHLSRQVLAWRVFGREPVQATIDQILDVLHGWGYQGSESKESRLRRLRSSICQALLINRSPRLEDLTTELMLRLRTDPGVSDHLRGDLYAIQSAVAALGYADAPPASPNIRKDPFPIDGAPAAWVQMAERWYATSTLTPAVRRNIRVRVAMMGRWLTAEQPGITEPGQWTRETCAAWVAAVDRMRVGDYVQHYRGRAGAPLAARTKDGIYASSRAFFRDLQEWGWIPRRFDPARALGTPRSVVALINPNPRVIADDIWAKLLWAGLNLQADDLPTTAGGRWYPIELVRAVTLTWLFGGLRSDEIVRLRVGCVRWQHDDVPVAGDSDEVLAKDAVCMLDVPVHKTGTAFAKPVDPLLGKAIEAWQAVRPAQPPMLDRKTGERVDFLFAYRARRIANAYINLTVIPTLCRKAGVPRADVRGTITSHRARSTIASQLYNAKEPMTLFELGQWLGHRSLEMVQHYAKIHPTRLAKAYRDAGYFTRNMRTIEVLVDRDAVTSGAAAQGAPWQYYDLGHGWCTYTFFEQCPHRMACARCDFYAPKASTKGQLLEAKDNLQRMTSTIPLTDDERAAVEDGQAALDQLLARLADVPTPAGPSPRDLGIPATATRLPILSATSGDRRASPS